MSTRKRPPPAVTALDVARRAGVSRSAVSRTFTEGASVAPRTRQRVLTAARALKYRPNLAARSLITRRSHVLGIAVSWLDNQFYPVVVQQLTEEAAQLGYGTMLFVTHGVTGSDPLVEQLLKFQLDGLVLASSSASVSLARECHRAGLPVVMFNNVARTPGVSTVATDNALAGRTVASYLLAGGHRRFAFIAGFDEDSTSREREQGFIARLRAAGTAAPVRRRGLYSYEGAQEAVRSLLALKQTPDAIVCANDHMAFAALQTVRAESTLVPGRDISIVGFDDVPIARWPAMDLTTYSQPWPQMVRRAIHLLLDTRRTGDEHLRLPGEMVVRGSARTPDTGTFSRVNHQRVWYPDGTG